MKILKVNLTVLVLAPFLLCGFVHCENDFERTETPTKTPTSTTQAPAVGETTTAAAAAPVVGDSTRYARLLKVLRDPKAFAAQRYHAATQRVIARADHQPPAGLPYRRALQPHVAAAAPPSAYHKMRPPIMRRVQNGLPVNGAPPRFAYDTPKGGQNHLPSKSLVPFNAGKVSVYRPPFTYAQQQTHPNSLVLQSAATVQATKHQLQQPQPHFGEYNFQASPPFSGKAIVRPLLEPHDPNYRQHLQQLQQYAGKPQQMVQQYPIPQQQQHQQQQQQQQQSTSHFPTLYQSALKQTANRAPTFHYETMRPHEEPVLHPHVKHEQPPPGSAGYAVYEHNDLAEEEQAYAHPHANYPPTARTEEISQQYQRLQQQSQRATPDTTASEQQAEEYIKFMNSNDYFLPKREPNYRQRDTQQDSQQNSQQLQLQQHKQQRAREQQQQQQTTHNHYPHTQSQAQAQQQHSQHIQYSKASVSDSASFSSATASAADAATNYLNQPIQVSQLFYQEDPVPSIVRGSYQAGNNLFVVKSDGNKAVKHVVPSPSTRAPTTQAPAYAKVRYNSQQSRTPEPQRFEFTERDAVHSAYTNSPPSFGSGHEHLHYRTASEFSTSTTPDLSASSNNNFGTATMPSADDPEDDEDVQSASSDFYGRVPPRLSTSAGDVPAAPTSPTPVEQKDTEDYCERMCANVQDGDEEIVCGSDGYMYTSEAQMECYASCLHIGE
ncbi:putative uncharacterized protein DDB_G0291608 [Rhagoletis pomonella]|uniref:putative uncharacterized protein DDB_G0291608 n=1 Tax=Rhagoletis pomonella TaxID=28610 RepID=UPI00177ADC40|nr:putative uncharacterized protein DDB_G0291608 [Rhagoletis pomonella]